MANTGNVIGQFKDEVTETAGEVAQDVKDSVGEMIEQAVQITTNNQLTPQQIQQKQSLDSAQDRQEDQRKEVERQKQLVYTRRWLGDLQMGQQKVRQENKQKEQQRLQSQQQEKQVVEMKKEEKKKQPINPAIAYAGKAEFKRGVGG